MALITELDGNIHALFGRERLVAFYIGLFGFFVAVVDANLLLHGYNYSPTPASPPGETWTEP
jgi:hypothetical protein